MPKCLCISTKVVISAVKIYTFSVPVPFCSLLCATVQNCPRLAKTVIFPQLNGNLQWPTEADMTKPKNVPVRVDHTETTYDIGVTLKSSTLGQRFQVWRLPVAFCRNLVASFHSFC